MEKTNLIMFLIMYLTFSINAIMIAQQYDINNSEVIGQYIRGNGIIGNKLLVKVENMPIEQIQSTFYHELGHHIYSEILTKKERNEWKNISSSVDNEFYFNDYDEGFARWFESYYNTEGKFADYLEEEKFIETILRKKGIELR